MPQEPIVSQAEPNAPKERKGEPVAASVQGTASQARNGSDNEYIPPSIELLKTAASASGEDAKSELQSTEDLLADTLQSFGIESNIIAAIRGPSVTRYELELERGIKLSKLTNLSKDIALSLGAVSVRIAPIPGKNSVVGIEVPNRLVSPVPIRAVLDSPEFRNAKSHVSFAVGKDISNRNIIGNIAKMPHLLIAGTTGSGKSVCTNSMIISLLYKSSPKEVRLIMIDPKMVELSNYNGIPHLLIPVVTDPKKAAGALQWAVFEMMRRYQMFANRGVRDLATYNQKVKEETAQQAPDGTEPMEEPMPQIVIFIDELADLMLVAAKEVEESICRVAQMGRAAGMHLVIATQRPSADVITGLMKANIPSRIALAVASSMESRIILDATGAESLVGNGDMLFAPLGKEKCRVQGCYISDKEVNDVIESIKANSVSNYSDEIMAQVEENAKKNEKGNKGGASAMNVAPPDMQERTEPEDDRDPLYMDAAEVVIETGMASVSMLQRRLKLGYSRAARLVDQLEEYGVVGPFEGSKPRKVLVTKERWNEIKLQLGEKAGLDPNLQLAKAMSAEADQEELPFDLED
jgi:S-DNA-T family DNA segregation ATPase FtsK/SpoIIIE